MKYAKHATTFSLAMLLIIANTALAQKGEGKRGRRDQIKNRMSKDDNAPKVGDAAPTFKLKSLDGKSETDLASFKGKKPVVLFFGSYT